MPTRTRTKTSPETDADEPKLVSTGDDLILPQMMVDPTKLLPHPGNARIHDDATILDSLSEFDLYQTPTVNSRTGRLIRGHGTVRNFIKAYPGRAIQVSVLDVTDDRATRILLMDNQSSDKASNDPRLLAELLGGLEAESGNIDHTGFDPGDLTDLLESLQVTEPVPPSDFNDYGDDIATQYGCPSCGYEWSGQPHPGGTHKPKPTDDE